MFDVTWRISYKNGDPKWYKDLTRICDDIPIVSVGNKVDLKRTKSYWKSNYFSKANFVIFNITKYLQKAN